MPASLFALRQGTIVSAGAGTGKTHSLVTLCLHLLGGAGRAEPLPAAKLCAITFTEKAAAELQWRIRQRVDRLASGANAAGVEPELAATCAESGQPPPAPELWQRVRRDLGNAHVGTIHSLCGQILRRHAGAAGVPPSFTVLDELDAPALLREACEAAALAALDGTGEPRAAADRLCSELGLNARGRFQRGLADELQRLVSLAAESGARFDSLLRSASGGDPGYDAARSALKETFFRLGTAARTALGRKRSPVAERALASANAFLASAAGEIDAAAPGELGRAWPSLGAARETLGDARGDLKDAISETKAAIDALLDADAQVRADRLVSDLATLAELAARRYADRKRRAGALDFDDLTRGAERLLATNALARRAEKERIGALLVDEFQDTSAAQLALLGWLAEPLEAEGLAPAGSGKPGSLAIAAGRFVAVGDRKQSIYEFRGADVASSQAFAARAVADGATVQRLRTSRRSLPALVQFANALFARALAPAELPFHTPFVEGEDDLHAHRPAAGPGPCAELIRVEAEGPDAVQVEADAVARRIAQLLAAGTKGGDIAVLLRAFTHVDAYRRALLGRRIPHLVWRGRGFFAAREVTDLLALLSLAADPDDRRALATVLRSPLALLSDEALVLLARKRRLSRWALCDAQALAALAADDAEAARRTDALLRQLSAASARLGPAALLELALAETGYVAACAAGLHGEQAAANVDKLLALARRTELRGDGLREMLARAAELTDEEAREADAPVVEERAPHAVRLMTVHAAKGLEFPVVVVPECGAPPVQTNEGAVIVDRELGGAVRVAGADGKPRWGPRGKAVQERRRERELAQSRRLFYVAATRARDLVVFSGRQPRSDAWRKWLDELADAPEGPALLKVMDGASLVAPPLRGQPALAERDPALAAALREARAVDGAPAADWPELDHAVQAASRAPGRDALPATVVVPVTQLADAALCARRYELLHELGIRERPDGDQEREEVAEAKATDLGTLAHRLLERAPFAMEPAPRRREALERLARDEGQDPGEPAIAAVIDAVAGLLSSPLGRKLADADPARVHRELPFALRIAGDGIELLVRGQIDALLLEDGEALVIDYKLAAPHQSARYELQLDAYALAAHELVRGAVPVRTALAFLKRPPERISPRPAMDDAARAALRSRLAGAAAAIAQGRTIGRFALVEPDRCRAIGCGFLARCHGREERPAVEAPKPPRRGQLELPW